jgi:hypothetical protein
MTALRRRLDRLEQSAGVGSGFTTIIIRGGLSDDVGDFARAGETGWTRRGAESVAEFRRRAEGEARAAGKKFLVVGGLPIPDFLRKG